MKTIGVIIPNYNSGIYIKRCLDSLLEQEYRVNEIIVVDDCSTDESTKIVKEYTKKYNNIILLENEKNMGVSYSRNRGIENTKSEYIMFCDSDDWYEKQATKKMMEKVEDGADFVFVGYYITYKDGRKIEAKYNTFNNIEITKETCISYLPITSWAKLIKKSILVEHNIKYPVGIKNCEELPVIPVAGFYAQKIVYIDECLYNYFQRENSASNHRLEDLSFYDITYEKFKKGIGTHAYSEIVYNSSGYDIFDTWVGMDQYVSERDDASVQFKIFVDGKLKAQTGVMKANTPKERLVVDVRNSSEIKLVVDVATNGNNWDHANWADARFRNVPQFSTVQLEKALKEAKKLDLNNYTEQSIEVLENAIKFGEDALNSTNQEVIDSAVESLNSAIDSLVELNLNKVVNIKDEYLKQSIQKELNTSGEITIGQMRQLVSLKVSNAESLEGLQYAINLESLDISYNEIRDLSPLKNLKKLTDLKANPLGGLISGRVYAEDNKAKVSLDVINRNGEKLLPTSVVVKHNKTHEYTTLDINDCMDKNGVVTIDTTGFDSYIYTIYLVYEDKVDNYTSQFMFMLDNI